MYLWEGQFLNIVLSPLLITMLPLMSLVYLVDFLALQGVLIYLTEYIFLVSWFKRMVDTTTIYIWGPLAFFTGYNLIQDSAFWILCLISWVLLLPNIVFFGSWTLILWPVSILVVVLAFFFVAYIGLG